MWLHNIIIEKTSDCFGLIIIECSVIWLSKLLYNNGKSFSFFVQSTVYSNQQCCRLVDFYNVQVFCFGLPSLIVHTHWKCTHFTCHVGVGFHILYTYSDSVCPHYILFRQLLLLLGRKLNRNLQLIPCTLSLLSSYQNCWQLDKGAAATIPHHYSLCLYLIHTVD